MNHTYTFHELVLTNNIIIFKFWASIIIFQGSPIWDPDFTGKTPAHVIAAAQAAANADANAAAVTTPKKRPHAEEETDQPEAKRHR